MIGVREAITASNTTLRDPGLVYRWDLATIPKHEVFWGVRIGKWPRQEPGFGMPYGQSRMTGRIVAGESGPLTMVDQWPDPPKAGERVKVFAGVCIPDAAEPGDEWFATVRRVKGDQIWFTTPYPRTVEVHASLDKLREAYNGAEWLSNKVAPWGERSRAGNNGRGDGLSHGMVRFPGGSPTRNVTIDRPLMSEVVGVTAGMSIAQTPPAYPISAFFVDGLKIRDVRIINTIGPGLHLVHCGKVTIDKMACEGVAVNRYADLKTTWAPALSLYGGDGIKVKRLTIKGVNWGTVATEITPNDFDIGPCDVDVTVEGIDEQPLQVNTYGWLRGKSAIGPLTFRKRVFFDTDMLWKPYELRGVTFQDGLHDWFVPERYRITGPVVGAEHR